MDSSEASSSKSRSLSWLDRSQSNALNCLRLIFAWAVIFSHAYPLRGEKDPLEKLFPGNQSIGHFSVDAFFIISGFLITSSWLSGKGLEHFLRSRILRIWPGCVVAIILSIAIAAASLGPDAVFYVKSVPLSGLPWALVTIDGSVISTAKSFPSNPFPNAVNGSLWTIQFEFACYLAVAYLGSLGVLKRPRLVLVLFLAGFAVYLLKLFQGANIFMAWSRFVTTFGAGAVLRVYSSKIPNSAWIAVASTAALAGAFFIPKAFTALFPVAGTYLIFWLAYNAPGRIRSIGSRNDISYGVYLYAFPIQQLIYSFKQPSGEVVSVSSNIILTTVAVTGLAWLSWLLVEKPASAWGKRMAASDG